jgi:hypothetical protein
MTRAEVTKPGLFFGHAKNMTLSWQKTSYAAAPPRGSGFALQPIRTQKSTDNIMIPEWIRRGGSFACGWAASAQANLEAAG